LKIKHHVELALEEFGHGYIDKDKAVAYVMGHFNDWVKGLNAECATLGRTCMGLIYNDPDSKEFEEAKNKFRDMVEPLSDAEKLKRRIDQTFKRNQKIGEIEVMRKELEDYKTRNRKAYIKFTGDQFKEFIKNISKRDTNATEVCIEIEHGSGDYKIHFRR
jgi:hypothetical protein